MKHYRYDVIGACLEARVKEHPLDNMKNLGYKVIKAEPVMIMDCWWFRVENEIDDIPSYLYPMRDDFKFPDERET